MMAPFGILSAAMSPTDETPNPSPELPERQESTGADTLIAGLDVAAECGGACACATCHVYVDEAWREKTGSPSPMEEDMLDFGFDVKENSRLSCQIKVTDELDGLVVRVPERQA